MDYTDLSDEIEIEIPKHAQANYQYVMIRYLLLLKTAKKAEIIESLQRYNQNNENNYYQSVFDTLVNSKFNIIEKNKKYTLSNLENFNDEQRYELVSKCDKKIQEMHKKGFGTNPVNEYFTFNEAAKIILKEQNQPMHYIEITNIALAKNLIITEGATPNQTMSADIRRDIEKNGIKSDFIKTGESTFFINYKYAVVESKEELKKVQEMFIQKLEKNTTKSGKIMVSTQEGVFGAMAGWISSQKIWWASNIENIPGRYWNAFGLDEPQWDLEKRNRMIIQFNIPVSGRNRTTGGVFLKDHNGQYFIAHNGTIGGGSKYAGKRTFQNFMYYSDRWVDVIDSDNRTEDVLLISNLDDADFFKNISEFIQKTEEFKNILGKEKFLLNPDKFEKLHENFLKYIYDKSIENGYTEEEAKFVDFSNKYLITEEIVYKNNVVDDARNILEIEKWNELKNTPGIITEKLKQICQQKISKALLSPPKFGDVKSASGILYKLESNQIPDFEKKILNLFLESTEEEIFSKNFNGLIEFLEINKLPVSSQFLAYVAFIADKEKYIPIRMKEFETVLKYYENYDKISNFSWKRYNTFLTLIKALKAKLSEKYHTPNTIEAHSYLWVVSSILKSQPEIKEDSVVQNLPENKNDDFEEYFKILENKNQFIFYGPPGTGKTWNAKQISNEFIEKSEVVKFSEHDYENYVQESLEKVSKFNNFKFYLFGDNNFSIKNSEKKIRGKFYFIQSGKKSKERCEITVDAETIEFLSDVESENRFLIIINSDTKNFLVIPHDMIIEKFQLNTNHDTTGKSKHRFIVNISKDKAEYYFSEEQGEEQFEDCSNLLHNFEYMFNQNNIPCKFFEKITFHQSFSYEEFIEGIRPEAGPDNKFITYPVKSGIFKKICSCARADQKQRYVLLIDEINRGNISKIFGELITLIEKDKRGDELRLPYSKEMFEVPPNLYVIGTMNTADRSLVKLDIALRRRFAFVELMPNSEVLADVKIKGISVREILNKINQRIDDHGMREYQIGHSYFMTGKETVQDISKLQYIFAYEIIPLLKEYFFNDNEKLKAILKNQFINWDDMTIDFNTSEEDKSIFEEYLTEFMK